MDLPQLLSQLPRMDKLDLSGKQAVVRADLNVPVSGDEVLNQRRIIASLPTLQHILRHGGSAVVLSHLGRPKEGHYDERYSLRPVAKVLAQHLNQPVEFAESYIEGLNARPGEVVLCENVRFLNGEKSNDPNLAQRFARLGDCFIMDAFGAVHRAHASTAGAILYAPQVACGLLLYEELNALSQWMNQPLRPAGAIVGGAKISDKLKVLRTLLEQVDWLIPGGGIANTLLASKGCPVGKSLYEPSMLEEAKSLFALAKERRAEIVLPKQLVCAPAPDATQGVIKACADVAADDLILDIPAQEVAALVDMIHKARKILWNGPMGLFESAAFSHGTAALAREVARSEAYTVAGGGDTVAAIEQCGVEQDIDYISTGGGAMLELVEGKLLPGLEALLSRSEEHV